MGPEHPAKLESVKALLLCLAQVLAATLATPPARADERDVQAIVQAVEARYRSATTLKAVFLERYSEGRQAVRVESGTVYFRRPGRMRWEYESPETKLFLVDGRNAWFYVPADHTVTRAPVKESMDWRTPLALLTGKAKLSRFCARLELVDQRGLEPGRIVLRCVLRRGAERTQRAGTGVSAQAGESDSMEDVLLEMDESRNELTRILVRQSGGVELEFRFGNWQQNIALPEVIFHFQPPVGVAIVEEPSISGPLH